MSKFCVFRNIYWTSTQTFASTNTSTRSSVSCPRFLTSKTPTASGVLAGATATHRRSRIYPPYARVSDLFRSVPQSCLHTSVDMFLPIGTACASISACSFSWTISSRRSSGCSRFVTSHQHKYLMESSLSRTLLLYATNAKLIIMGARIACLFTCRVHYEMYADKTYVDKKIYIPGAL